MKKNVFLVLFALSVCALAVFAAGAAEPANTYVPEGAEFVRSETEDGFTEHKYRDSAGGEYELIMDGDTAIALDYDSSIRSAAKENVLTEDTAFAAVTAI